MPSLLRSSTKLGGSLGLPQRPLESVQLLRAMAAVGVLCFHAGLIWQQGDVRTNANGLLRLFHAIGYAGVDLFFVISGLIMVYTSHHNLGRGWAGRASAIDFLRRRAIRLLPIYWLCSLPVLAARTIAPSMTSTGRPVTVSYVLKSLLLLPQDEWPLLYVGWTLTYEAYFYLCFALLFLVPRAMTVPLLLVWSAVAMILHPSYAAEITNPDYLDWRVPLYAAPLVSEFALGCLIGLAIFRWPNYDRWPLCEAAMVTGGAALLGWGSAAMAGQHVPALTGISRAVLFGIPAGLMVYGFVGKELRDRFSVPWPLLELGSASYSLYLTHTYVLRIWLAAGRRILPQASSVTSLVWLALGIVACLVVAIFVYRVIERPITTRIRGGWKKHADHSTNLQIQ